MSTLPKSSPDSNQFSIGASRLAKALIRLIETPPADFEIAEQHSADLEVAGNTARLRERAQEGACHVVPCDPGSSSENAKNPGPTLNLPLVGQGENDVDYRQEQQR